VCRLFQIGGSDPVTATPVRRALILTASVKTLPVAVTVLSKLGPLLGGMVGVAVVPCVLAHLSQIIIDSVMVSRWKSRDAQKRRAAMQ
jgi:sodium/bile acid cotransporter 7